LSNYFSASPPRTVRAPFSAYGSPLTAGRRCLYVAAEAGGVALLIDAKNERVAKWYASYGAVPLLDAPLSLLLPFKTIHSALATEDKL
jgi:hypothetical protein